MNEIRRWHRWIMTVFGLLLLYWAASGLTLAIYDATDSHQVWAGEGGGPGASLAVPGLGTLPDPATLAPGIASALQQAGRGMTIASVDLRNTGRFLRLQFAQSDGDRDTMKRFDAASGASITADHAEGFDGPPEAPPDFAARRNGLKSWHKGNALGLPGQFVGLLAGLSLLALAASGLLLYFKLWAMRRRSGKPAFFWRNAGDGVWRRLHRAVAIVAAAFVLNIAITGCILAVGEIQLNLFLQHHIGSPPYPRPTPMPPPSQSALPGDIAAMLGTTYRAARAQGGEVQAIQLVMRDGVAKGLALVGGARPAWRAFDAQRGTAVADEATGGVQVGNGYFTDWHQVLKRLHRGDIVGHFDGRLIDIAAGLATIYLVVSSLFMYAELRVRRRKAGRGGWFWQ